MEIAPRVFYYPLAIFSYIKVWIFLSFGVFLLRVRAYYEFEVLGCNYMI